MKSIRRKGERSGIANVYINQHEKGNGTVTFLQRTKTYAFKEEHSKKEK